MKSIKRIITLAMLVMLASACSKDDRHGTNSQDEVKDKETNTIDQNDSVSRNNNQNDNVSGNNQNDNVSGNNQNDNASGSNQNDNASGNNNQKNNASGNNNQNDSLSRNNNTTANTQQRKGDSDFVLNAVDGGLLEVRLGELAKQNGSSKDVKDFARSMTIDHGKINNELKNLAHKVNVSIPETLSEENKQKYNDLAQKKGTDFDAAYTDIMVADHQETIALFQEQATKGQNQELREWAAAKIPILRHHHEMAQKINDRNTTTKSQK